MNNKEYKEGVNYFLISNFSFLISYSLPLHLSIPTNSGMRMFCMASICLIGGSFPA